MNKNSIVQLLIMTASLQSNGWNGVPGEGVEPS